jgi:putative hydrolase of the HAD superfamily
VTLDFWSTLYRSVPALHSRRLLCVQSALTSAGCDAITEPLLAGALQQAWTLWDRVWREEQRTWGGKEWLSAVLDHLDVALPEPLFATTVAALQTASLDTAVRPEDGTAEMLARLAPRYRLGLISDTGVTPGTVLRSLMERDGLLQHLDHLIFSDEFGRSKPYPDVFLAMLDRLAVRPQEAVHVGDRRRTDVAGARSVGMRTVRYAGIRDETDDAYPDADAVIESHDDLEAVLGEWALDA